MTTHRRKTTTTRRRLRSPRPIGIAAPPVSKLWGVNLGALYRDGACWYTPCTRQSSTHPWARLERDIDASFTTPTRHRVSCLRSRAFVHLRVWLHRGVPAKSYTSSHTRGPRSGSSPRCARPKPRSIAGDPRTRRCHAGDHSCVTRRFVEWVGRASTKRRGKRRGVEQLPGRPNTSEQTNRWRLRDGVELGHDGRR